MIILRKAKYGTGYRDLGHVARISTTLIVIRTKLIYSLFIEYDRLYTYITIYVSTGDRRTQDLCVFV